MNWASLVAASKPAVACQKHDSTLTESRKISWSKSGCVASITRDGRGVNLRAFQRNPVDGRWILGDEAPLHIPSVHEEFPLVHVSWGHLGVDLAVVDAAGRILVYTAAQAADRMKLSREPFSDHESESNALVGLHWLPVSPQQVKVRDRRRHPLVQCVSLKLLYSCSDTQSSTCRVFCLPGPGPIADFISTT